MPGAVIAVRTSDDFLQINPSCTSSLSTVAFQAIEDAGPFYVYIAIFGVKNRIIGRLSFG